MWKIKGDLGVWAFWWYPIYTGINNERNPGKFKVEGGQIVSVSRQKRVGAWGFLLIT